MASVEELSSFVECKAGLQQVRVPAEVFYHFLAAWLCWRGVVTPLDWAVDDTYAYLVMTCPGVDVKKFTLRGCRGKLPDYMVKNITRQMLNIAVALDKVVIEHRDLKLDNFIINPHTKRVQIIDFGIAVTKQTASRSVFTDMIGTPEYMPPEAFEREKWTAERGNV